MNQINLSKNLARLRRDRKITQEELADFIGVTKAAVSKWENGQTTPDILLLPQLANFFGVTVDELIGYVAQLSEEQIRRRYQELCESFVKLSFAEAWEQTRAVIHRYYSCYPFLFQAVVLYLNHYMLADSEEEKKGMLKEALHLCQRILQECRDVELCADAMAMKAVLKLRLGMPEEAIELLKPFTDLTRFSSQNGSVLIQAYCMAGKMEQAKSYAQARHYVDLLNLIGDAVQMIALQQNDRLRCAEIMRRVEKIMELYQFQRLHPNLASQYYYQAALAYMEQGDLKHALTALGQFQTCVSRIQDMEEITLHGDGYFDLLDEWIESFPLKGMAPRDKSLVKKSALDALSHPAFLELKETSEFQNICDRIRKGGALHD